jgi:hypothetical protein
MLGLQSILKNYPQYEHFWERVPLDLDCESTSGFQSISNFKIKVLENNNIYNILNASHVPIIAIDIFILYYIEFYNHSVRVGIAISILHMEK